MKANSMKLTDRQREWLSHIRRARARKMPLAQYCRAEGLSVQTLYNVRHELWQKGERGSASRLAAKKTKAADKFVAVRIARPPAPSSVAACRVHLKDVVIECASLPPPAWLAQLTTGATHAGR